MAKTDKVKRIFKFLAFFNVFFSDFKLILMNLPQTSSTFIQTFFASGIPEELSSSSVNIDEKSPRDDDAVNSCTSTLNFLIGA